MERPTRFLRALPFALLLAGAACSPAVAPSPTPAPTSPPTAAPSPAAQSARPVPTAAASTAPARPSAAPAVAASPQASPAASAAALAPGATRLSIVPGQTSASFQATEQLAGRPAPSPAIGLTHVVSGSVVVKQDGSFDQAQSRVVVDLASLQSDRSQRDNFIKRNTLDVSKFPTATFVPTSAQGLPSPLPTSGQSSFKLAGNLTVHGTTKPETWDVKATFAPTQVTGTASTTVTLADFGMPTPHVSVVLSIEPNISLVVNFVTTRQSAS